MVAQQDPVVGETKSMVCDNKTHHNMMMMMIKGKRTKRSRPMSPLALTMSSATATTTTDEGGASSATSEEFVPPPISTATTTSEEEEDMAHCLILLAQGSNQKSSHNSINITKGNISSSYECKTCNKSFSSFQALGGHRASHKKPKPTLTNTDHHHDHNNHHFDEDRTMLSLQIYSSALLNNNNNNNNKGNNKVHECGICGAEFSSGQALGGHMRRHRPIGTRATTNNKDVITVAANNNMMKEEGASSSSMCNLLSLDLNLPAPEDEVVHLHQLIDSNSTSKFVFPTNEKTLVFSASSQLVDCHY